MVGKNWKRMEDGLMRCMNPKCDSEEFNMGHVYSLTDTEGEESFWVVCNECETSGPDCENAEEARSYFEDQPEEYTPKPNDNLKIRYWDEIDPRVEDSSKWSDEKASPIEDIKKFSEIIRNEILTVFKTQEECIESMQSLTPMFREGEKVKDFSQRVMDRIAESVSIPAEVLDIRFASGYSACKEALDALRGIDNGDQIVRGAAAGKSFFKAFVNSIQWNDDLQFENGEMAMVDKKSFRIVPIDKKGEPITVPIVDPTPLMESMKYFKVKLLGIPFDMSKEREIKIADRPVPEINLESFSDKCNCGSKAEITATTIKCTNPECYHYKE